MATVAPEMPSAFGTKQAVSLVIFDLDNTLFDWVAIWYAMFSSKLAEVVRISGISDEILKPEFKRIHQQHGTTEYPFAVQELPSLQAKHPGEDTRKLYDSALHAYYSARKRTLATYPGVVEVLQELQRRDVKMVAYTESLAFYSAQRLRDLDLDLLIEVLYSPEDHQLPNNMRPEQIRQYPEEHYRLRKTIHRHTPKGELKPNPDILRTILSDVGVAPTQAVYVGDSLMKDIAMANVVGVTSVWAKYGIAQHLPEYQLLRDVTHWTDEDVAREKAIAEGRGVSEKDLIPNFTLESGLPDLLNLFEFVSANEPADATQ